MATEKDILELDAGQYVDSLEKVKKGAEGTHKAQKDLASHIKEELEHAFMSAQGQLRLLEKAYESVKEFAQESVHAFLAQQEAVSKLDRALANAGPTAGQFKESLVEQAEALERVTGQSAESVMGIQSLLVQMKVAPHDVGRFTEAIMDLSAATGRDATAAAMLLARANAEGKDELKRYAISVDEADFATRGFISVVEQIEKQMGGASKAVPPMIAATRDLKGAWEDFQKSVGQMIIPGTGVLSALTHWLDNASELMTGKAATAVAEYKEKLEEAEKVHIAYELTAEDLNKELEKEARWLKETGGQYGENTEGSKKLAEQLQKLAEKYKALTGINLGGKEEFGYRNLGTLEAIDPAKLAAEDAKRMEAADKLRAAGLKKAFDDNKENVEAKRKIDEEDRRRQEEQDKYMAELRSKALEEEFEEDEKLEKEKEALRKKQNEEVKKFNEEMAKEQKAEADRLKKIWDDTANTLKGFAQELVGGVVAMLESSLTENTKYAKASFEMRVKEETLTMSAIEAQAKRVKMEKEFAADQKAAQAQQMASVLANIAGQAAVKAIMESAEGVASFAAEDYAGGAQHLIAAGLYAGVAAAAGGSAAAISSSRSMTAEEKASLENSKKSAAERAAREEKQGRQAAAQDNTATEVNVYHLGITGQTDAEQGRELARIQLQYSKLRTGAA